MNVVLMTDLPCKHSIASFLTGMKYERIQPFVCYHDDMREHIPICDTGCYVVEPESFEDMITNNFFQCVYSVTQPKRGRVSYGWNFKTHSTEINTVTIIPDNVDILPLIPEPRFVVRIAEPVSPEKDFERPSTLIDMSVLYNPSDQVIAGHIDRLVKIANSQDLLSF